MVSKARQKVDPLIRDMFDPEVERPEHDDVLVSLFGNDSALTDLFMSLHNPKPLPTFSDESTFQLTRSDFSVTTVGMAEAVAKTGVTPSWASPSPIRIAKKSMEVPMLLVSEHGRTPPRVTGFCDIGVAYEMVQWPMLYASKNNQWDWERKVERYYAQIEVKAAWPTAGNLIRQLNLYQYAWPSGCVGTRSLIVVGPDASMNDLACQHGYRLATFSKNCSEFTLQPDTRVVQPKLDSSKSGSF